MPETRTLDAGSTRDSGDDALDAATGVALALVVAWCASEPFRVGESLVLPRPGRETVFGRGAAGEDDAIERVVLRRVRPGSSDLAPPIRNAFVSRTQLRLRGTADGVHVTNVGKRALFVDDVETTSGVVREGSALHVKGQLLMICVRRAREMPPAKTPLAMHPFGEPDAEGIVGESPAVWQLRERVAFAAARSPHVLLLGASGTGKELVAQALHALSSRSKRRMVARNAATFPAGLIDAELFGNTAGYPNPGMPERPGVVGEADGSTLFLDEIGELPNDLQAHLLRFLDEKGEYQRLGDARRRTSDVRVVAATNRAVEDLKHDLAARLQLRIDVPSLDARIEDVPLIARHLLRRIAARDPEIGARFFAQWDGQAGEPRVTRRLVSALLGHTYETNVRELESLLWCALSTSTRDEIDATAELRARIRTREDTSPDAARPPPTAEEIRVSMEKHAGVQERVWRELGLANRYVLKRLLKKHAIAPSGDE